MQNVLTLMKVQRSVKVQSMGKAVEMAKLSQVVQQAALDVIYSTCLARILNIICLCMLTAPQFTSLSLTHPNMGYKKPERAGVWTFGLIIRLITMKIMIRGLGSIKSK